MIISLNKKKTEAFYTAENIIKINNELLSGNQDFSTSTSKDNEPVAEFCSKVNNGDYDAAEAIAHATGLSAYAMTVKGGSQVIAFLAVLDSQNN